MGAVPASAANERLSASRLVVEPRDAAWIAAIPVALLGWAAIAALGPPLGRLLFRAEPASYWPFWIRSHVVAPEPTEQARYVLAVLVPLLWALVVGAVVQRRARLDAHVIRLLAHGGQAAVVAFAVAAVLAQHWTVWHSPVAGGPAMRLGYFSWASIAFAAGLAALTATTTPFWGRALARLRDTPRRHVAATCAAALLTAMWLLSAINTESSLRFANEGVVTQLAFPIDEPFAVLNGQLPLVDFHSQYTNLLPYLTALALSLLGTTVTVLTVVLTSITGAALLAVFAMLRRITRSALAALALYAPFMATGFFMTIGPQTNPFSPANLFSMFPGRYAGPYLLAWLTARHLDGAAPRRRWVLLVCAGLVLANNFEFGIAALAATVAALVWSTPRWSRRSALAMLGSVVAGLLGAAGLVALLTLTVGGRLPDFLTPLTLMRHFAGGYGESPMPAFGLHLALYATFAAAIGVATVRALSRSREALLTGMLAWSGVFGLGVGGYYVGESHPWQLILLFSAWALALVLLVVAAARELLRRNARWPRPAELAVLFGFGLMVCSLAQMPPPWAQIERIGKSAPPVYAHTPAEFYVDSRTVRGEHVLMLMWASHHITYDIGIVNVASYEALEDLIGPGPFFEELRRLRAAGGHRVFLQSQLVLPEAADLLRAAGFVLSGSGSGVEEWRSAG